ncbi:DUF1819 family protein [Bifidobacterium stellenboschense]|uniref:Inner membrane protein (DUF1819) n=1 Tax=Bifidobacterium stellenboschense TaxID=762211 RepID=A0A087E0N3_9BIFI|nr:DUF1819 family protein [Bifidobacterium stellenboschense]KFJ01334.1 hypothetical protein BSTEL_1463 [Bifidobacterium stellenboschense]
MPGAYGSEIMREGRRYRLSFTVGGLLAPQGRILAALFMADGGFSAGSDAPESELGERVERVRQRAIDGNVLAIRTHAANVRMVREVLKRLSALTERELRYLAAAGTPMDDCRALMWLAMCRYYAIVGEFADEVLRDRYLMGMPTVTRGDYDRFILAKAMWHPELEELSPTTAGKLRSNVFKAMDEAGLVEKTDGTLLPSLLGAPLTAILECRPESFAYFPIREH